MNGTDHSRMEARRLISTMRASAMNSTLDIESFDARLRSVERHLGEIANVIASGNPPPRIATVPHFGTVGGGAP